MRILWCLLSLTYLVQAQYESPLPPRALIPGAEPIGVPPGRARIRPRLQPQISQDQGAVPARVRRPLTARTRPLPIQDSVQTRARPQLYQDTPIQRARPFPILDSPIPRARPLPLQETPLAKSRSYPEEESFVSSTPSAENLSPKPVTEEIEEDIQEIPASPSTPLFSPNISPSPLTNLEPKIYRATSRLDDPLLKQPQRALFKSDGEDEYPPQFRPAPVQRLRPLPPPPEPVFETPVQRPVRPAQRTRPVAPSHPPQQQLTVRNREPQPAPRPVSSIKDDRREKKPVAQVIRKYREENEDGSITWGFENDDGTWKEENIGFNCVVRGKYGYVDPDGVRREYTYTSGNPCDRNKQQSENSESVGFMDYETNQYVLPNGQSVDLRQLKNRARKPVQPKYQN